MTPTELALAKRLAEHPRWEWVEGMRAFVGPYTDVLPNTFSFMRVSATSVPGKGYAPDLADWPTLGAMMEKMGDAFESLAAGHVEGDGRWVVYHSGHSVAVGGTLSEAIARAWLAVHGDNK